MKKMLTVFSLSFILMNTLFAQTTGRYVESEFALDTVETDVVYGTAPAIKTPYAGESNTEPFLLEMNIYEPKDDTLSLRPVLIVAHGGGFIEGEKEHDDMLAFCDSFARKGYVTATIQYRQGMNITSEISAARAVYRGLQDGRAAIRFIKEKAADYNIDTNRVYFLGSSAGAFMALHNLYMNEESERPAYSYQTTGTYPLYLDSGPDLGGLDATGNDYVHNAHPDAVVSLWGALADTTLIKKGDPDSPVLLVHGTADDYVFFNVGKPFSISTLPPTYGSNPVSQRLKNLSYAYETYFVNGEKHEFYGVTNGMWDDGPNAYWDSVVTKVTQFLYKQHKPTAAFNTVVDGKAASFTDNSNGAVKWQWDFGDDNFSNEQNPVHNYTDFGTYRVSLAIYNEIDSWDTLSQVIEVKNPSVVDSLSLVALYESTNGSNWTDNTNWLSDSSFSTWFGINEISGRVRGINISYNQLNGELPADLSNLSDLRYLYLIGNQISGTVPSELGDLTNLEYLYLHDNSLTELPDFSGTALDNIIKKIKVEGNKLDFGDIEPNIGVADEFTYSPQDSVGSKKDTTVENGSEFIMSVSVGGTANKYQWMKDGVDITGAEDNVYAISAASAADSGSYVCKISNTIATELTLYSRPLQLHVNLGTAVADEKTMALPKKYALEQNYPNPFNPSTKINYALPEGANVKIEIYNILGQKVAVLLDAQKAAGYHSLIFNAADLSAGVYFYSIKTENFYQIKKMLLVK